jgi:uncharacterized RDD family membrane protein YckC
MTATPPPPVSWESPASVEGPAPGVEFAPHGARLVAYILDTIILGVVITALLLIGFILLGSGTTVQGNEVTAVSPAAATGFSVIAIVCLVIGLLYFPFFWARGGQTPGMRPFSLRVVRDRDGGSIGWGTAFLRLIGLWVAGAVFYIGYIWIFIDKRRRGWQDLIAGTVVVKQP